MVTVYGNIINIYENVGVSLKWGYRATPIAGWLISGKIRLSTGHFYYLQNHPIVGFHRSLFTGPHMASDVFSWLTIFTPNSQAPIDLRKLVRNSTFFLFPANIGEGSSNLELDDAKVYTGDRYIWRESLHLVVRPCIDNCCKVSFFLESNEWEHLPQPYWLPKTWHSHDGPNIN